MDLSVCKQLVADLQQERAQVEQEMQTLLTEDYYVLALEKNLSLLGAFRHKLRDSFERLPFGVQRQIVLAFVEDIHVRERREVVVKLKVTLNNEGVQHLCDELDAVESGVWSGNDEDELSEVVKPSLTVDQSGPTWRPQQDSNL